jgi:hypothetical protein
MILEIGTYVSPLSFIAALLTSSAYPDSSKRKVFSTDVKKKKMKQSTVDDQLFLAFSVPRPGTCDAI